MVTLYAARRWRDTSTVRESLKGVHGEFKIVEVASHTGDHSPCYSPKASTASRALLVASVPRISSWRFGFSRLDNARCHVSVSGTSTGLVLPLAASPRPSFRNPPLFSNGWWSLVVRGRVVGRSHRFLARSPYTLLSYPLPRSPEEVTPGCPKQETKTTSQGLPAVGG